jgi:hypothetical protein
MSHATGNDRSIRELEEEMFEVVRDVVEYLRCGLAGGTLRAAEKKFGALGLRHFCIKLASWWGRSRLLQSRHPYLPMSQAYPWHTGFREFVESVPELRLLLQIEPDACHFSIEIPREQWQEINDYVRANYRPMLRTASFCAEPHYGD